MSRIERHIREYFGDTPFSIEDVAKYLRENDAIRWLIYRDVEREFHKKDILEELDYMNDENDTNYTITPEELYLILENYEDKLGDSEEWHYILRGALEDWFEEV